MTELESLALLIANLNIQVRALQAENSELRKYLRRTNAENAEPNPEPPESEGGSQ